jgi:hypothetical protein
LGGWIDMGNCQLGWPVPDGLSHRRGCDLILHMHLYLQSINALF